MTGYTAVVAGIVSAAARVLDGEEIDEREIRMSECEFVFVCV